MSDSRWISGAGLAAVAAVVAHAGFAGLADPRALAVALAGAALAAAGLALCANRLVSARRFTAADLAALPASRPVVPFSVVVSVMLVLQGAAHLMLLAGGVHAGAGVAAAPALHVVLAILAAVIVSATDRALQAALRTAELMLAALLELLVCAARPRRPQAVAVLAGRRRTGPPPGRAPPLGF